MFIYYHVLRVRRAPQALDRTTSVLLFNYRDEQHDIDWMIRDLPGQPQFYSTNIYFLGTSAAVFLVVTNLCASPDNQEKQLRLWLGALDSLASHALDCRVAVVCTHADRKSPVALEAAKQRLQRLFE